MKGRRGLIIVLGYILTIFFLSACSPSQADLEAISSQVAAGIFSTQTAEAPTPTPTPTLTPTPTETPCPILTFVTPLDGETLDFEEMYFQINPVPGAEGYSWTFRQNGQVLWETIFHEQRLTGAEYNIPTTGSLIERFTPGELQIQVQAKIGGRWTVPATITLYLDERLPNSSVFVPRYMLPSAPFYSVEILGTECNYQGDIWGEKAAYIAYACPDLNVTWLSVRFANLEEGETAMDLFGQLPSEGNMGISSSRISPKDLFGQFPEEGATPITPADLLSEHDNLTILGRVENSEYVYFMVYEAKSYVISSEVFFPEDITTTLEEFYLDNGEKVLHAVLEIMLENIKSSGASLRPTPMAVNQQQLYNQTAHWLVTGSEANEYYKGASDMWGDPFDGTWVPLGDDVNAQRESVCRIFEDISNADAPLVTFFNCVFIKPDYELDTLQESFPNSAVMESAFEYPEQSIIYGHILNNGHASLNAFILQDEYLIYVFIESRTLMGQSPEDVFKGFNDGFIYNVLMVNLECYGQDD